MVAYLDSSVLLRHILLGEEFSHDKGMNRCQEYRPHGCLALSQHRHSVTRETPALL